MGTAKETLAVIGCGAMGEALIRGLLRSKTLAPEAIIGSDVKAEAAERAAKAHGIRTAPSLAAAQAASIVLCAVKPHHMADLLDHESMQAALAGKLVISIAAGVRLEQLAAWLPKSAVIRAMPNTPCLIGEGMTAIARGPGATAAHATLALALFSACGRAVEVDGKQMDAVTALVGSGPAFAYLVLESLADGAVLMGLRRDQALPMAAQVLQGAARMVLETGQHPAALKDQVATPGGCTIAGLIALEDGGLRGVLARAVEQATKVAAGLGTTK